MTNWTIYFIPIFLQVVLISYGYAQNPRDIISRYFDTVSNGEVEKWKRVESLYAENIEYYKGNELMLGVQPSDKFISYRKLFRKWPDKTKEELYSDSAFTLLTSEFVFTSKEHLVRVGGIPVITSEAKKHLWFEFFPVLVENYLANSTELAYLGMIRLPNETVYCHEIQIKTSDVTRQVYFNIDTFLLEAIFVPEGNYLLRLSDYKIIGGYLLPTCERSFQDGDLIGFRKFTKMVFNPELPGKVFKLRH